MDDKTIISMFFERDQAALSQVAIKYGKLVFRVCDNILHCKEDARECVNDTYLALWNSIPPHRPEPFISFVCKIARNISIKKLRSKNAAKRSAEAAPLEELEHLLSSFETQENIDAKLLGQAIDRFLDTIDKESRIIFIKRYWFCDEVPQIANELQTSEGNVYTRLSRTRKKLKLYLEKEELI